MIRNKPKSERPRERCLLSGAKSLSTRECLALVFGSGPKGLGCLGLAERVINSTGDDEGSDQALLFSMIETEDTTRLSSIAGLGKARKSQVLALFELARRYEAYRLKKRNLAIHYDCDALTSRALRQIPTALRMDFYEWFGFTPFWTPGRLGELVIVKKGSRTQVQISLTEIFAKILTLRPCGVFVFHGHPSGSLLPSQEDRIVTKNLESLLQEFSIKFFGHWIVTSSAAEKIYTDLA